MSAIGWLRKLKTSVKECPLVQDNTIPTIILDPTFYGSVSELFFLPNPYVFPTYGVSKTYSERAQDIITCNTTTT